MSNNQPSYYFETPTCKQEYASARHIEPCKGLQKREKLRTGEYEYERQGPAPCAFFWPKS